MAGTKGAYFKSGRSRLIQAEEPLERERARLPVHFRGPDLQVIHENRQHGRRHIRRHHEADDAAETPLPDALLDGFEQVLRFEFLDRHIGVARDVEWMRLDDLHARKQGWQIGGDDLLEPHQFGALRL